MAPAFNSADPQDRRLALCRTGADWRTPREEPISLCVLWPPVYCEALKTSFFDVLVEGINRVKACIEKYIALYLGAHTKMQAHTYTHEASVSRYMERESLRLAAQGTGFLTKSSVSCVTYLRRGSGGPRTYLVSFLKYLAKSTTAPVSVPQVISVT